VPVRGSRPSGAACSKRNELNATPSTSARQAFPPQASGVRDPLSWMDMFPCVLPTRTVFSYRSILIFGHVIKLNLGGLVNIYFGLFSALALWISALPSSAFAQPSRWIDMGETGRGKVFLDSATLRRSGQTVRAWTKWTNDVPEEINVGNQKTTYNLTKLLAVYDCANSKTSVLEVILYGAQPDPKPVQVFSGADMSKHFSDVTPESWGETILHYVCSLTPTKRN
jgi:hypothetical protein